MTGAPIPLGGVFVRRDVPAVLARKIEGWVGASLAYARAHPRASREFVRHHAQEMDEGVTSQHIGLYVNEFTAGLGAEGEDAVRRLLAASAAVGASANGSANGSANALFVADAG